MKKVCFYCLYFSPSFEWDDGLSRCIIDKYVIRRPREESCDRFEYFRRK